MNVSADKTTTQRTPGLFEAANLLLLAAVLYGLCVRTNSPGAGLAALVATAALGISFWKSSTGPPRSSEGGTAGDTSLLIAAFAFGILGVAGWAPSTIGATSAALERVPGAAWACLALGVMLVKGRVTMRVLAIWTTTATLLITLTVGLIHLDRVEGVGLDVNLLHIAAADAIANGDNPYTEAVVVPNGSPTAEPGDTIVGYPYPPVTAISYALGEWVFSDPRFTSLLSWLVVLGLIGMHSIRRQSLNGIGILLIFAALPGWPLVLRAGWSEPLSLLFLTGAFLLWRRPLGSGLALGFGLASKQYFVVAAPVALLHRDEGWLRRLLIAVSVVAITVGAVALLDFDAFWSAAVEFHLNTPIREDSSNLIGLMAAMGITWSAPGVVSIAVGLVTAVVVGLRSRTSRAFLLALGLTLTTSFLVASQAFANYWFLAFGLCALAMLGVSTQTPTAAPGVSRLEP